MKLVKGTDLTPQQRQEVLGDFTNRWTFENSRKRYGERCIACFQQEKHGGDMVINGKPWHQVHVPLVSDEEWLRTHSFYISDNGHLAKSIDYCEKTREV